MWCVKEDSRALQTSRKKAACSQVAYVETGTNSQLYCLKYIPKVLQGALRVDNQNNNYNRLLRFG